jgi:hypothetical protein
MPRPAPSLRHPRSPTAEEDEKIARLSAVVDAVEWQRKAKMEQLQTATKELEAGEFAYRKETEVEKTTPDSPQLKKKREALDRLRTLVDCLQAEYVEATVKMVKSRRGREEFENTVRFGSPHPIN